MRRCIAAGSGKSGQAPPRAGHPAATQRGGSSARKHCGRAASAKRIAKQSHSILKRCAFACSIIGGSIQRSGRGIHLSNDGSIARKQ